MILNIWKNIKIVEKIFLILTLLSIISKYSLHEGTSAEFFVSLMVLSILYFPLGFYFLGKSSDKGNLLFSILLGFFYSIGIIIMIYCTLKVEGHQ